ncbi:type II toxin-antitoxin system Phd/YefM family antitoxin [Companilactobacillus sp.]|uniref:type II toxin-antitoxin system Phd/YefM family antitoxin n=1 Tax=Companilactobacillus sp. TaxID=2767905 RepID=UPI0025BF1305|nr:type II toxin-antitoxin system Phd/YefM family antitoxin [Companilactobacillus sp.]MCH4009902.1 type II toxin-antitoxin system Phd/YefM family antitoxin [Companilactobacillus sp.]MCH4052422.1 type II toxin-antitoxin system Phd/YefM family antitoxin [Companilactobacillus sp.]MCH4077844.1 type II toxin-antitoxin system Phd/YefM family antitoxin [Companilactobacillus sp.]MCH4126420.1 type II toxin-antitoxin system Phd/YefM family antitoxin [Companilactobacillus sp.]MCI1312742.1 type II toxin-a
MDSVNYTNFRKKLKEYMTQVNDDSEPLIVTNKDSNNDIVVLSKDDYDSMNETMRILSNPPLMDKIRRGDAQFSKNKGTQHNLIDSEEM